MTTINVKPEGTKGAYTPYGGAKEFLMCRDPQIFLYGSAGCGKTTAGCYKMMLLCMLYPGCKFLFTRKSYKSLVKSGVETFERVLREQGWDITSRQTATKVRKLGEQEPREYQFPYRKRVAEDGTVYEGVSRVVLASLDRVYDEMGAEYDFIYVNQPEQITEEDWQFLATRANGRRGCSPYPQLYGDPNPEDEKHWINLGGYHMVDGEKEGHGTRWRMIRSTYKDNPIIWDQKLQCLTKSGEQQIGILLQSLNPVMAKRLIEGEWCSFEGLVFGETWERSRHLKSSREFKIEDNWERYWAIDFGFTDPFVCLMFARKPGTDIYVCYKYIYKTGLTVQDHASKILDMTIGEPRPKLIVADRNPESIAVLSQALGLNVISAKKGPGSVKAGINVLTDMLKRDQLIFLNDACVEEDLELRRAKLPIGFEEEVDLYRWNVDKGQDEVIGGNDHALDAARYLFTHLKATQRVVPFIWD